MDKARSNELQNALMAHLGDMVLLTAKTGEILFANATVQTLGYSAEELNSINLFSLLHPDDRDAVINVYDAIGGMPGTGYVIECRMRRSNGEYIWTEGKLVNMLHNRSIGGIITTVRDITEHKLAYEHVHESEKKFRFAFEQVAIGMANMTADGHWLHMNSHLCAMTGYSSGELYYMKYTDLYIEADRADILDNMNTMLGTRSKKSSGYRQLLRRDGNLLWVEELLTLIHDEEGGQVWFTLVLKDINAIKNTETQLAYRNKELDTFIYRASHDLRGPITTIMGLTDIAMLDTHDELALEYLRNCRDVAMRMEKTVYDLLVVTQVKQSKITLMSVLPREIIYRTMHDKKHAQRLPLTAMEIQVDDTVAYCTDAALLSIIITQLMDNALIFRRTEERHKVEVRISATDSIIKIAVRDNGVGISPADQSQVFDLYYRGRENHTGAGIGLYLVKSAVEKLEGSIRFSSAPGMGTEMLVYLPNCTL